MLSFQVRAFDSANVGHQLLAFLLDDSTIITRLNYQFYNKCVCIHFRNLLARLTPTRLTFERSFSVRSSDPLVTDLTKVSAAKG